MIVVTTPTGRIGSQVAERLLAKNEQVRVVARHPDKLAPALRGKVEVEQGSLDDEGVMLRALEGAESVFLVVPPCSTTTDNDAYYLGMTRPAIAAMKKHGVKRAVGVSALGRGYEGDAGVVSSSLEKDAAFAEAGLDYRALWCPGFMDNLLMQVESLRQQGVFFWPARPTRKRPWCATRDIADVAVRLLLDRSWTGQGGVAVLGPEDLSLDETAAIMSDVLGRPIRFQSVPVEAFEQQMVQRGASAQFAAALRRMFEAKDDGLDDVEPRTAENTTPTSFRQWCEEELKPAMAGR